MDEEKEKYIEQTLKDFLNEISLIEKMSTVLFHQVQKLPKKQKQYKDIKDNAEVLSGVLRFFKMRLSKFYKKVFITETATLTSPIHSFESS